VAKKRNELMCNIADEIFIAHAAKGGKNKTKKAAQITGD